MLVTKCPNIDAFTLRAIAAAVSHNLTISADSGRTPRGFRFKLWCNDHTTWPARKSASGRRLHSASWEAHRAFLAEFFARYPGATVRSALANYRGKAEFERLHGATYHHNAGSTMHPVEFGEL